MAPYAEGDSNAAPARVQHRQDYSLIDNNNKKKAYKKQKKSVIGNTLHALIYPYCTHNTLNILTYPHYTHNTAMQHLRVFNQNARP